MTHWPPVATYSIVACDLAAREWGVAVQSRFLAVGAVVPHARAEVGAVATQAYANWRSGGEVLALLERGVDAPAALEQVLANDTQREERQVGVVDADGRSATFTGARCFDWAGGRSGHCYAAQGNILVSAGTVDALAETFERGTDKSLGERLIDCLEAAQGAGGDRRGQQSAALLVVKRNAGYAGLSDSLVDLRVDDHPQPVGELRRLHKMHELIFGSTPRERWVRVDESLHSELEGRLRRLGYAGDLADALYGWAATENLEDRYDGVEELDPVLLDQLRDQTSTTPRPGGDGQAAAGSRTA